MYCCTNTESQVVSVETSTMFVVTVRETVKKHYKLSSDKEDITDKIDGEPGHEIY